MRRLVAAKVGEISGDLGRKIDRKRLAVAGLTITGGDVLLASAPAKARSSRSMCRKIGELLGIDRTVGGAALEGRRLRKTRQGEQIAIVRKAITENDERRLAMRHDKTPVLEMKAKNFKAKNFKAKN